MEPMETGVQTASEQQRKKKKSSKIPLVSAGLAGTLLAGYLGLCVYAGSLDTFYPNRHINGIDVGGLSVSAAQKKLETELPAQRVTFINEETGARAAATLEELGYSAEDFAGDAQFWKNDDRSRNFLTKGWAYLSTLTGRWPGGASWPGMDREILRETTDRLTRELTEAALDGSYTLTENRLRITKGKDGRAPQDLYTLAQNVAQYSQEDYQISFSFETLPAQQLTAQQIYNEVHGDVRNASYDPETDTILPEQMGADFDAAAAQAALDAAEPGETVDIRADMEWPEVTAAELEQVLFRDVLGEATTHVSGSAGRRSNVKLSAQSINGLVLNSGETFSYNESVGKRTAANGYQPAPAYVKGETVNEIGGGICQTSSTLYLACLLADLEITERYAHRYVPAYIAWGMDATVSWGGPDYKFTNNTPYPVKIVTRYENNYLTIQLLGTNPDGRYVKMSSKVLSTTPWETIYQEDPSMAPGAADVVKTTPYTGYSVQTFQTIYNADGTVLDSHYEASSNYKVRNKVILQAPAAASGGVSAEIPGTPADETPGENTTTETPADTVPQDPVAVIDPSLFDPPADTDSSTDETAPVQSETEEP